MFMSFLAFEIWQHAVLLSFAISTRNCLSWFFKILHWQKCGFCFGREECWHNWRHHWIWGMPQMSPPTSSPSVRPDMKTESNFWCKSLQIQKCFHFRSQNSAGRHCPVWSLPFSSLLLHTQHENMFGPARASIKNQDKVSGWEETCFSRGSSPRV